MILPVTINDGEAAILWSRKGTRRIVHGPNVVFAPLERLDMQHRFVARDGEFLVVRFQDGTTEHLPGPCEQWFDPLLHGTIEVKPAVNLDAHQAVVIYREIDGEVSHRVLRRPAVHVPQPNEWLHRFEWHRDDGSGRKVPGALQFEKLRVIPDQMYFDVEGVRTADEALVTVRLMVFFDHERAARDREEEQRTLDHRIEQSRLAREDELTAEREREELAIQLLDQRQERERIHQAKLAELQAREWQQLQETGVDLTAVLVARERNPDKLIRLEQASPGDTGLHLHEAV
jgi:hypothetical protein